MRRWLVGVVMVLAVACSGPPVDDTDVLGAPTTTVPQTTTSSTSTTVPVPPDIQDLVATTTMTDRARRLFLAASPAVEDPDTFARSCGVDPRPDASSTQPRTHTQGCYVAGRIHLRAPDKAEGRELLYVVAAHELLHAVYAALGSGDRSRIDAELMAARTGNERLEERLKSYATTPTLANEIHSILGSEFEGLSPALETHYAQYFSNRSAVVAVRQRTLGSREEEIKRLRTVVNELDARIDGLRETQETLRAAGDIRGYNANVPVINGLISRYNAQVDALNAVIDEYNGLLGG